MLTDTGLRRSILHAIALFSSNTTTVELEDLAALVADVPIVCKISEANNRLRMPFSGRRTQVPGTTWRPSVLWSWVTSAEQMKW
jgi:hypothetical protein